MLGVEGWILEFRNYGLGFELSGWVLGFRIEDLSLGSRVQGAGCWVWGLGWRAYDLRFRVNSLGFKVQV